MQDMKLARRPGLIVERQSDTPVPVDGDGIV